MSYTEYIDLFLKTQKKDCPFRAFTFDVVNSRKQEQYINIHDKFLDCIFYVYTLLEQEEKLSNTKILLKDKYNNKLTPNSQNNNLNNPMILGDMVTYFVYNGSITQNRMIEIFKVSLKKHNIQYPFHFATGVYETNIYAEGGIKLYKGYMPQILESLSKKNSLVIKADFDTTNTNAK